MSILEVAQKLLSCPVSTARVTVDSRVMSSSRDLCLVQLVSTDVDLLQVSVMMIMCDRGSPVKMLVKSLTQVRQVSAGSSHSVLLTTDGHVLTCGSNHVSSQCHHHHRHHQSISQSVIHQSSSSASSINQSVSQSSINHRRHHHHHQSINQ